MTTLDFITELFCRVDDVLGEEPVHAQAHLHPSEVVLNQVGLVSGWSLSTANTHDSHFRPMVAQFAEEIIVLTNQGFHGTKGDPPNMKVCRRGEWNPRMLVEPMLSMVTTVCHFKKVSHRKWRYFEARLAYTLAVFNMLLRWDSAQTPETRQVCFSIAMLAL